MIKKLFRRGSAAAALMLAAATLVSPAVAEAQPDAVPAAVAVSWPTASPTPEYGESKAISQQEATDWVNRCTAGRYCAWVRDGSRYSLFQFYTCGVYTLANWGGTSNFYNNQNVSVQLLGSRHEILRTHSPYYKFITNWDPVYYINLCA